MSEHGSESGSEHDDCSTGPHPVDGPLASDQAFRGHDLETGILQRVRRWRDAIPALVLIDALRVAGSPLYVGSIGLAVLVAGLAPVDLAIDPRWRELSSIQIAWPGSFPLWHLLIGTLVTLAVVPPAALVMRAGGCYAAGRWQSFSDHGRIVYQRGLRLVAVPLIPLGIGLGLGSILVAAGALARLGAVGGWLAEASAIVLLPITILIAMIVAGAFAAVPLALASVVLEKNSDSLDSLSRGYEYLFRRPVTLAFYGVCASLLIWLVWMLASLVIGTAIGISGWALQFGAGQANAAPLLYQYLLAVLPTAVAWTAACGQVGAIYLLMRQSANDQELEDIAVSPTDTQSTELTL